MPGLGLLQRDLQRLQCEAPGVRVWVAFASEVDDKIAIPIPVTLTLLERQLVDECTKAAASLSPQGLRETFVPRRGFRVAVSKRSSPER